VALLAFGAYLGALQLTGNVHAVQAGQLYRAGQLDSGQFVRVVHDDSIRSILNLRGAHPAAHWYDAELAVARRLGVTHYDFGISAERIVTPAQIDSILQIVRAAPKPLLIHCQGGADRSGLVSALYQAVIEGRSAGKADDQLSLRYGHFPWLGSRTDAMDKSFWAYVAKR
jgi:protein tyrosine/serine phosphatase